MEPSKTISLLANVSRFVILTFAAAIVLPPALPSQTARELIAEACYNELQHRETKTLWSYTAQRRVDNHIFLERVIETVDGPVRHLLAADGYPPTPAQIRTSASFRHLLDSSQFLRNNLGVVAGALWGSARAYQRGAVLEQSRTHA